MKVSKKAKRRYLFLSVCIIGLIAYVIFSLASYWMKIIDNKSETRKLKNQYQELLSREAELESEVTKLQDPDYIARYASEKYLFSKDGMTIIRVLD